MQLTSIRTHRRLLFKVFALAVMLGALSLVPVANAGGNCDTGCVAWDAQNGCTVYMTCCVNSPTDWICIEWSPINN